jgi:hypothetical protein
MDTSYPYIYSYQLSLSIINAGVGWAISSKSDIFPPSFDLASAFLHLDCCLDFPSSHIHGWPTSSLCIVFLLSCKQHYRRSLGYHSASLGRIGTIEHAFFPYHFLTFPVPYPHFIKLSFTFCLIFPTKATAWSRALHCFTRAAVCLAHIIVLRHHHLHWWTWVCLLAV